MSRTLQAYDFVIVGAGSAGCVETSDMIRADRQARHAAAARAFAARETVAA